MNNMQELPSQLNPSSNNDVSDVQHNYGTITDNSETGPEDFGYYEFSGKDGRTCPTCKGTGRIAKHQEEELVALIPYNDQRLKPSRTKAYVLLAVVLCLLVSGLVLFFLLPRTVSIEEDGITSFNVSIDKNQSSTSIVLRVRFTISNTNFFAVKVSSISVQASFDKITVGHGRISNTPLIVGARRIDFPVTANVVMHFDIENKLTYVSHLCTSTRRKVHDIVIKLQTTQTVWYLGHSEQYSITSYRYIDCSLHAVISSETEE